MKIWFVVIAAIFSAALHAKEVPIIDYFQFAQVSSAQISPDGKYLAFTYEKDDKVPLAVMDLKSNKILSNFEFDSQKHVFTFFWVNNERVVMGVRKVTGNLDTTASRAVHYYAANFDGTQRRQFYGEGSQFGIRFLNRLKHDPKNILVATYHWSDERGAKIKKLDVYSGEFDYVAGEPKVSDNGYLSGVAVDEYGNPRIGIEGVDAKTDNLDDNYTIIHIKKGEVWDKLKVNNVRKIKPEIYPAGFSDDYSTAYFYSNHDMAENDRSGLFAYDYASGKLSLVHRFAVGDIQNALLDHKDSLIGVVGMPGKFEKVYTDDSSADAEFLKALDAAFPGQYVSVTSFTEDGTSAVVRVFSDVNPGEFYLFDVKKRTARFLAATQPHLSAKTMQPMEPVSFEARDGVKIHALLTRGKGLKGPGPLVLLVHGGPYGIQDTWGYDREAQVLASRGYSVLQVNYRGSGGYGDDFQRLGRLEWGGKMQDDVTDATLWAVEQGIADKERLCIYGGSYGGYAALQAVVKEPDLYKCAIGFVGVYDMLWFRDGDGSDGDRGGYDQKRFNEMWMTAHIGNDREQIRSRSPVHNVDRIKAKLFIVHGKDDVRVPVGHAYRLRDALDKVGKDYEWMIVDKEGHGFMQPKNNEKLFKKIFDVLEESIGK